MTNRESRDVLSELEAISFVKQYKYLDVPINQSLTLKNLASMIKTRVKKFNTRIGYIMNNIVSLKARLKLWSAYIRCIFDYSAPLWLCAVIHLRSKEYTHKIS